MSIMFNKTYMHIERYALANMNSGIHHWVLSIYRPRITTAICQIMLFYLESNMKYVFHETSNLWISFTLLWILWWQWKVCGNKILGANEVVVGSLWFEMRIRIKSCYVNLCIFHYGRIMLGNLTVFKFSVCTYMLFTVRPNLPCNDVLITSLRLIVPKCWLGINGVCWNPVIEFPFCPLTMNASGWHCESGRDLINSTCCC